ncbi:DUF2851 family protein [Porphyromonas canoris]|uniref:DUF2851 domain-containing protein n=1 Tax=Porphyromonas canoris TaxID=36875 RepID=A0ABR4XIT5_9PORP|nr:DUF2851 family protein [Porphyromonas canoris]KGN91614.1 hypothetical protein HQ43_05765 [Porphyromonas canoris]
MKSCPETYLHYIWKHRLYSSLTTVDGIVPEVLHPGEHNHGAGPDFLSAKIRIGEVEWVGAVEIHTNASEWKQHGHDTDPAYSGVILHVVLSSNSPARSVSGYDIPTAVMQIDSSVLGKLTDLNIKNNYLRCLPEATTLPPKRWKYLQDLWLVERLEQKSKKVREMGEGADWSQRLYVLFLRYMGMGHNNGAFEQIANSLPLSFIRKHANRITSIEAMLLGQAGLLAEPYSDEYHAFLGQEYLFYAQKFGLTPMPKGSIRFLRLRPVVFPTRMLAISAAILQDHHRVERLFSNNPSYAMLLSILDVEPSPYFCRHYHFGKPSDKKLNGLGTATKQSIIINVFLPLLWTYYSDTIQNEAKRTERKKELLDTYKQIAPENNRIVRLFEFPNTFASISNAGESQALIQLYKSYCMEGRCMNCPIAVQILREE